MSTGKLKICPRCKEHKKLLALCRRDNLTMMCPECGQLEAFEDKAMISQYTKEPYWDETKYTGRLLVDGNRTL